MKNLDEQQYLFIKNKIMEKIEIFLHDLLKRYDVVLQNLKQENAISKEIIALFSKLESEKEKFITTELGSGKEYEMIKTIFTKNILECLKTNPNEMLQNLKSFELNQEKTIAKINFMFWKKLMSNDLPLLTLFNLDSLSFEKLEQGDFYDFKLFEEYYSKHLTDKDNLEFFQQLNKDISFTKENVELKLEKFLTIENFNKFFELEDEKIIKQKIKKEQLDELFIQTKINNLLNHYKEKDLRLLIRQNDFNDNILKLLANSKEDIVREEIAKKENLAKSLVVKLAKDKNHKVRMAIAGRKTLPLSLIEELSTDENSFVRTTIAERHDLPKNVIKNLANDSQWIVTETVLQEHYNFKKD